MKKKSKRRRRTCGNCTECCTHIKVEAFNKPAGAPCPHICRGGCAIYADRPHECKAYTCGWIDGYVPTRPDLCGLIFERAWIDVGYRLEIILAIPCTPDAEEKNQDLLASLPRPGRIVHMAVGDSVYAENQKDADNFVQWLHAISTRGGVNVMGSDGEIRDVQFGPDGPIETIIRERTAP